MLKISSWFLVVPGLIIILLSLLFPNYIVIVIVIVAIIIIIKIFVLSSLQITLHLALCWHLNSSYQAWKQAGAQNTPGFLLAQTEKLIQLGNGTVNTSFCFSLWFSDIS